MSQEQREPGPLADIIAANGGKMPTPEEIAAREADLRTFHARVRAIDEVGDFLPEEDDPNVLIYGPWLERGGSAFWVSTAGTGKSIGSNQLAHAMSAGKPFCGLRPRGKLKFWIFQSEDSPRRVAQDRIDVRAELSEQYPDEDWDAVGKNVKMISLTGKVGVEFLEELDGLLRDAARFNEKPDVLILNPFLAFVGGSVTDGAYVTPFLRGGSIDGEHTEGLQAILERHAVGVLVYHHTPKPPNDSEIDKWMKSQFPEYQGAGSADITNWGRSFVTMMKVKDHPNMVCVTAGKNGGELGWERVGGAFRRYMAYSDDIGVSGKGRHAWRDLTPEELDEVTGSAKANDERLEAEAVEKLVAAIKSAEEAPIASKNDLERLLSGLGIRRQHIRTASRKVIAEPETYRLTVKAILHPQGRWCDHIGLADNLSRAATVQEQRIRLAEAKKGAQA